MSVDVTVYKPGTVVRNRINPELVGTVHKSDDGYGFEVRVYDPEVEGVQASPTAQRRSTIARFWEPVEMPCGFKTFELGGIIKDGGETE